MPEHDLQPGMPVEKSASDQAQRMYRGERRKSPVRAHEPRMAFVDSRLRRQRITRMQIKRHIETLHRGPEFVEAGMVVEIDLCSHLRESVDERALEPEVADAAGQLRGRRFGILHRQSRNTDQPVRTFTHLFSE